eukprot:4161247-Amphidinium_carterae.1
MDYNDDMQHEAIQTGTVPKLRLLERPAQGRFKDAQTTNKKNSARAMAAQASESEFCMLLSSAGWLRSLQTCFSSCSSCRAVQLGKLSRNDGCTK